ncbi:hypothetical protein M9458_035368, partial [Cirrhinus mrigala]
GWGWSPIGNRPVLFHSRKSKASSQILILNRPQNKGIYDINRRIFHYRPQFE